jgi:hypothetical protein
MSSIIWRGDTFHGISVFGRGVFTDKHGRTYAGQHRDGHACGLGVATWSNGDKTYAEHGPGGQCDGRYLCRDAYGDTNFRLYERSRQKEDALVSVNGTYCMYNYVTCAPDDPRLLSLIAQVAPVKVRPAARAPHLTLAPKPSSDGSAGSFCRRRRSPPPWPPRCTPTPHAVAGVRATQPTSSKARPRSGACAGRVDVGGALDGALLHPNNRPSGADEASLTQRRCHAMDAAGTCPLPCHSSARSDARWSPCTRRTLPSISPALLPGFAVSPFLIGFGRPRKPWPTCRYAWRCACTAASQVRPGSSRALKGRVRAAHGVLMVYSRGLPQWFHTGRCAARNALPFGCRGSSCS